VRGYVDAILEVLENVVEHLFVFGVDAETRDGSGAIFTDGGLLHDERLGDGSNNTEGASAKLRRPRHRVTRPQHRRELDLIATHVSDRLRRHTTQSRVLETEQWDELEQATTYYVIIVIYCVSIETSPMFLPITRESSVGFLPRCMECRRGLAMRILTVRLSGKRVHCDKTEKDLSR